MDEGHRVGAEAGRGRGRGTGERELYKRGIRFSFLNFTFRKNLVSLNFQFCGDGARVVV